MAGGRYTAMGVQQAQLVTGPSPQDQPSPPEDENEPAMREHPLNRKDQKLQRKLQSEVDADDKAMKVQHPDSGPGSRPPEVRITGSKRDEHAAEYDWVPEVKASGDRMGVIRISESQMHDRKSRDIVLAHETAHQKDIDHIPDEPRADVDAAGAIGPQKAINQLHHFHKTNPMNDDPKTPGIERYGTFAEREHNIAKNFPDQKLKLPKHPGRMKP